VLKKFSWLINSIFSAQGLNNLIVFLPTAKKACFGVGKEAGASDFAN
jgi:hypothetical protein